jgi:hypothetical protein
VAGETGLRSGRTIRSADPPDPAALAALIADLEPSLPRVRHVRDAAYLAWRLRNPLADYQVLVAEGDGLDGYLLGHRTRVDRADGPTPTTIMDCEARSDAVWADLVAAALHRLPGGEVLMWARDLPPARRALLTELGMAMRAPQGRLTTDMQLPNLMVRSVCATAPQSAFAVLGRPEAWDLRSICGRSWR